MWRHYGVILAPFRKLISAWLSSVLISTGLRNHLKTMSNEFCDTKVIRKQTGGAPGSSHFSPRSESITRDTLTTKPAFFPPPTAAPDTFCAPWSRASLLPQDGCARHTCISSRPPSRSDCCSLRQGRGAAAL